MAKLIDLDGLAYFYGKIKAMLAEKLGKNDTAAAALKDGAGNNIVDTYAKKTDIPNITVDEELSDTSMNPVQNKVINAALNSKADSSMLSDYLPLAGGVCTGGVSAPNFRTGTGATNYFQCRKFRGEGDANTYYHAVDFGYSGHDSVDFYEYDPNWRFYKCTTGTKSGAVLVGNINENGWNGGAVLSGTPTAPTATVGTNTTQIATTAFVQTAVGSKVDASLLATVATSGSYSDLSNKPTIPVVPTNVSAFVNDVGYLTQHQSLDGYAKMSVANAWTAQQTFDDLMLYREKYTTYGVNGTSFNPAVSTIHCTVTGAFTLNLATLVGKLSAGQSSVFTAYFTANADYTLTITNAGTIKYIGNASDVAITSAGLLLNIMMLKDNSGNLTSIVQASKLS